MGQSPEDADSYDELPDHDRETPPSRGLRSRAEANGETRDVPCKDRYV